MIDDIYSLNARSDMVESIFWTKFLRFSIFVVVT